MLSRAQKLFFVALLAMLGGGVLVAPIPALTFLRGLATVFYIGFSAFKLQLASRALTHTLEIEITPEELTALDDRDLPIYPIFVPVYRETEVFPILVRAIDQLDYPKTKLDVKILLEEDDTDTIEVARRSNLPSHFKLLIVPHGQPRACNYGSLYLCHRPQSGRPARSGEPALPGDLRWPLPMAPADRHCAWDHHAVADLRGTALEHPRPRARAAPWRGGTAATRASSLGR
ncbi:MAG TPA: hypothetical protein VNL35_20805 [Chloroflexota bacterium]|nr:hypothetical protein [Chloroflexota bacterium]